MRASVIALLAAFLWIAGPARSATLHVPPGAQAGPQFNPEAATQAYLDTLPADKKARSDAYFEGGYWLILWDFIYGGVVSLLLLESRLSVRMRNLADRIAGRRPLQTGLYWAQYLALSYLLTFPLTIYEGFIREHQYGLSNLTFGAWVSDESKNLALGMILGSLVVMSLFGIVRRLPGTWHVWGAAAAILFQAVAIVIGPVFIAPLFNKYSLLNDLRMRDQILRIARQNGIPATDVYEVNASRQSNRVSANVSGFLGTERITLNDNLLNRASPEAVLAVMGHEMGHYVLNHIYKLLLYFAVLIALSFALLRRALDWSLARWGSRWGIRGVGDPAVVPLVVLILSAVSFVYTPVNNTLVRTQEYEADIFGLNTARQPDGFAEAALLLSEYRKIDPGAAGGVSFLRSPQRSDADLRLHEVEGGKSWALRQRAGESLATDKR